MKTFSSLVIAFLMIIVFLLVDTGAPIPKKIYAAPAKACKLSVIAHGVSPQPYGIIATVTLQCGTGPSILCEDVRLNLAVIDINTLQVYNTSTTKSLFCSQSGNAGVWLQLPSGTFSYAFDCIGVDTGGYYVSETGLFSR